MHLHTRCIARSISLHWPDGSLPSSSQSIPSQSSQSCNLHASHASWPSSIKRSVGPCAPLLGSCPAQQAQRVSCSRDSYSYSLAKVSGQPTNQKCSESGWPMKRGCCRFRGEHALVFPFTLRSFVGAAWRRRLQCKTAQRSP